MSAFAKSVLSSPLDNGVDLRRARFAASPSHPLLLKPFPDAQARILPRLSHYRTKGHEPVDLAVTESAERIATGFRLDRVDAAIEGVTVGYLKLSYVPRALFHERAPTIFHFLSHFQGKCLRFGPDGPEAESLIQNHLVPIQYRDASERIRKRLLRVAEKRWMPEQERFCAFHVDKPLVDYVRVEEPFQRQGIGLILYEAAARYVAGNGMVLFRGLVNQQSKAVWRAMRRQGWPVRSERNPYKHGRMRAFLDFQA